MTFDDIRKLHETYAGKLNMDSPSYVAHLPLTVNWSDHDPLTTRIEMEMSRGMEMIVPDKFIPHFEFEPFTEDELREMCYRAYLYKRANISKLRSMIRSGKLHATYRSIIRNRKMKHEL